MKRFSITALFLISTSNGAIAADLIVNPEDIKDFDQNSGVGCLEKQPETQKAETLIVCKSKTSDEFAWNAAMYRSKVKCQPANFSVFFNVPPSLPVSNGVHTAQMEIRCHREK